MSTLNALFLIMLIMHYAGQPYHKQQRNILIRDSWLAPFGPLALNVVAFISMVGFLFTFRFVPTPPPSPSSLGGPSRSPLVVPPVLSLPLLCLIRQHSDSFRQSPGPDEGVRAHEAKGRV